MHDQATNNPSIGEKSKGENQVTEPIKNHPQGDVNAFLVTEKMPAAFQKPKNAKRIDAKEVTLALGEATGHVHVVRGDFEMYVEDDPKIVTADDAMELARWFQIGSGGATIHHEKAGQPTTDHHPITLTPDSLFLVPGKQRGYRPEGAMFVGD